MSPVKAESPPEQTAENLLLVIQALVAEVHPQRPPAEIIGLDSRFEKDLGLDSLTRAGLKELLNWPCRSAASPKSKPPVTCYAPYREPERRVQH
jgi:hypothetical protein